MSGSAAATGARSKDPKPPVEIESILFRALALTICLPFVAGMSVGASAPAALGRPIAELQPVAVIRLGATADWVAAAAESVWVGSTGPYAAPHRSAYESSRGQS